MRDILFKNLTSMNHLKRDITLSEAFMDQGVATKTKKHFIYFVHDHALVNSLDKVKDWIDKYASKGPRLKNLAVMKRYNSNLGEENFEVKIEGNLYVLREQEIFNIDFTQVFTVDRKGSSLKRNQ